MDKSFSSNNTNKLSPQELESYNMGGGVVQIIQINLVLKNLGVYLTLNIVFK